MGGAAGEQQLYLRQPLPSASGLSVVAVPRRGLGCFPRGLRSLGDLFLCWENLPDCKCKVSYTFLTLRLPFASFHRKANIVSSVS